MLFKSSVPLNTNEGKYTFKNKVKVNIGLQVTECIPYVNYGQSFLEADQKLKEKIMTTIMFLFKKILSSLKHFFNIKIKLMCMKLRVF